MSDKAQNRLPDGWRMVSLGKVSTVVGGTTPDSGNPLYWNGSVVWITPTDLGRLKNPIITDSERHISNIGFKNCNLTFVPEGSVVLSSRAPIGHLGVASLPLCTNQGCKSFVPGEELDTWFLYYALKKAVGRLQMLGSGATFSEVSKSQLEQFEIPLPPLPEQQRITGILREQMAAIEKARAAGQERLEASKAIPAALMRQVFPQPGQTLPDGWQFVRLSEVCDFNPCRSKIVALRKDDAPTTFVPMAAVDGQLGIIIRPEIKLFATVKKGYTFFSEGDVLFAKITPCMQNGKHAIARGLIDGIGFASTEFHVISPKKAIVPEWIHFFVRQPRVLNEATNHFTGAVGQQRVPEDFLKSLIIPLPPLPEQQRIVTILRRQMATIEEVRSSIEEGLQTNNVMPAALLRRAFNGEL